MTNRPEPLLWLDAMGNVDVWGRSITFAPREYDVKRINQLGGIFE